MERQSNVDQRTPLLLSTRNGSRPAIRRLFLFLCFWLFRRSGPSLWPTPVGRRRSMGASRRHRVDRVATWSIGSFLVCFFFLFSFCVSWRSVVGDGPWPFAGAVPGLGFRLASRRVGVASCGTTGDCQFRLRLALRRIGFSFAVPPK